MSSFRKISTNQSLIRRFLDQPAELDAAVRSALEAEGETILLYAWADFDASLQLNGRWVVVTDSLVVIADKTDSSGWKRIRREEIRQAREDSGISGGWLGIYGEEEKLLAGFTFTNRQKRAFEQLRFLLQQQLDGHPVKPSNPDEIYAESVSSRIRDAQSTVAKNQLAVVWRLLGYFKPYRKEVSVGVGH